VAQIKVLTGRHGVNYSFEKGVNEPV